jgi:hypothetical protein
MIELTWEDGSPDAINIANFYWSIISRQHPTIKGADEACQAAYMSSGYFCGPGSTCDCYMDWCPDGYQNYGDRIHACLYDWNHLPPGCNPWGGFDQNGCPDATAKKRAKITDRIDKMCAETTGYKAMAKVTGDAALIYSNERASDILYNNALIDVESILVGMINTILQAGAIAGAIAGASQVFHYVMTQYSFQASDFLASFEPYNPPPIGGGGLS